MLGFSNTGADAFLNLNAGLSQTAKSALGAATDIRSMTAALDVLQSEQSGIIRGTALWQLYETEIKKVNAQLDILEGTLPVVSAEMKTVGAASTTSLSGIGKSLTGVLGGVRQLAYILPGIGMAGIFNLAFEAIQAAAEALFDFDKELTNTQRLQAELGEVVKNAGSAFVSASTKILQLNADIRLAKDGFVEKNAVVREYNKTLGDAIGKVSTFDEVEKQLIAHSEDYIHAMFLRAIANQALEESAKKAFEQQQKALQPSTDFLDKSDKIYNSSKQVFDKLDNVLFSITDGILGKQTQSPLLTGLDKQIKSVAGSLDDATASYQIFQKFFAESEAFAKAHQIKLDPFGDTDTDPKGKVNQIAEAIKKLQADLIAIQRTGDALGKNLFDIDKEKISAVEGAIKRLIELNAGQNIIDPLIIRLYNLRAEIAPEGIEKFRQSFQKDIPALLKAMNDTIDRELEKHGISKKNPFDFQTDIINPIGDTTTNKLIANRKLANEQWKQQLTEIAKIGDAIRQTFQGIFTDLLTKGKVSFQAIEQALASLIAKLIATVIEAAILSVILNSITGGGASIAGGAGFGNLLQQLLGGGVKFTGHAEGGIFTQPTLLGNHLFGESGPEALIPLSRMNEMSNNMGSEQHVYVHGEISGDKIILIQNKQKLRNQRNYGGNFN